jgi:hypothetical protein
MDNNSIKKIGSRPLGISGFAESRFKAHIKSVLYAGSWLALFEICVQPIQDG